ncbi:YwmB family TATA-box binding protein [Oceanobacillus senegalensis]|uniref:YwmB family TATA-box binding protein n=1 Tax=Oceanobacillus senegalensis TaxID=1936063 RepID=UPI0015C443E4|nr:YwmB family TATA-box binding protein [Oceanobacillus senegalensis]
MLRIIFISLLLLFTINGTVQGIENDELEEMATFVVEQDLVLEEWKVLVKEKKTPSAINDILNELKNGYKVTRTEDENIIKYQFRDTQKNDGINVLYNVNLPKKNIGYPELTVVMEGQDWNRSIHRNYVEKMNSITDNLFTNSKRVFSWINTEPSGIIIEGEFERDLRDFLNIQQTDKQVDTASNSVRNTYIYGYTPRWKEKITIENKQINVQVAITQIDNELPELTLGTPILIHEY